MRLVWTERVTNVFGADEYDCHTKLVFSEKKTPTSETKNTPFRQDGRKYDKWLQRRRHHWGTQISA